MISNGNGGLGAAIILGVGLVVTCNCLALGYLVFKQTVLIKALLKTVNEINHKLNNKT